MVAAVPAKPLNREDSHGGKPSRKAREVGDIRGVDNSSAAQRRRSHNHGIDERYTCNSCQGLAGGPAQKRRHVLDDHRLKNLLADIRTSAPPLHTDGCGDERDVSTLRYGAKGLHRAPFPPFQGNEHPRVKREGHARRLRSRRCLFAGLLGPAADDGSPSHSASIRATASSDSAGIPCFSRKASAAASFTSRAAISAISADTFPAWRRAASAFRFFLVGSSSEKLVVRVEPGRIMAV